MKKLAVIALGLSGLASLWGAPALESGIDMANADKSARIQDDLYLAVNGHWLATTEIPADKSNYGAFTKLDDQSRDRLLALIQELAAKNNAPGTDAQKVGDLYRSFMDEARIEKLGLQPLKADLDRVAALKSLSEVAQAFGALGKIGVESPFEFGIDVDAKDSTRYLAVISQSGLGLPDRDYYLENDERYQQARAAYVVYVEKLLTLAGTAPADAKKAAKAILEIETTLAKAQWARVDLRNPEKNYNKYAVTKLPQLAPTFPWSDYFQGLGLPSLAQVNVGQPSFVQAAAELLVATPVETWKHYLTAKLISAYAVALPAAYQTAHFELYDKVLGGVPQDRARTEKAVALISGATFGDSGALGFSVGKLYVEKFFPPDAKARMDELVSNLMKAYATSIKGLTWMSDATKAKAEEKLSKYTVKIGYPEKWRDYSGLRIRADDLFGNVKASREFNYAYEIGKLGKPVDRKEWHMTPQTVNAYYSASTNEIVFPAAILQPPFFNVKADDAVNYGGIGAVIGHEISHGFDDQGSQYDGDGNLKVWWTDADRAAFVKLTKQLVAQYAAYEPLPGQHLNGEFTLGENIADLSGLAIAYKAYRLSLNGKQAPVIDGFTGDQRFFMGWSQVWARKYRDADMARRLKVDPHSPSQFRANGAPVNSDAFEKAFDVKPGDKMYKAPAERIRIW
ncbi:peptidase M13 [Opitutaceae bacterium EW11]|nr:peptidase M13 [Opitutaceae bacterium EW11]